MGDPAAGERVAIVTGVGHRAGIGFAIARRLLADGARVLCHTYSEQLDPGAGECRAGAEESGGGELPEALAAELGGNQERLRFVAADLGDPEAPRRLVAAALDAFGAVDALVVNHAHSSEQSLRTVTAAELDRAWAVNARAAILLAQAFAESHDDDRPHGRIVLMTSGQHLGPMPGELPYVLGKGAVQQAVRTLADELGGRGITVNAVNPGPVDTGWPSEEQRRRLLPAFPSGRWGRPEDVAPVVAWLASVESAWVTGEVIDAEGGFRRSRADA